MDLQVSDDEPADLVFDFDEGRLTYIADMARQLSSLAAHSGQPRLTRLLNRAVHEACRSAKKRRACLPGSIVDCGETAIRVKP